MRFAPDMLFSLNDVKKNKNSPISSNIYHINLIK